MISASLGYLYLAIFFGLLVKTCFFLLGLLARVSVLGAVYFAAYLIFEQHLLLVVDSVLSTAELGIIARSAISTDTLWIYELIGYVVLVLTILVLFGSNLATFLQEACIDILLMLTGMLPLLLVARGLQRDNFFAQLIAKSPVGAGYLPTTIAAASRTIEQEWDKVFDLYMHSNDEAARKELERLNDGI